MPESQDRKFKILTLNAISATGLNRLPADRFQTGSDIVDPDAILLRSHNMHDMPVPENVVAVGRAGAGTNNIPINQMNARGIPVFNTPGANANAVKELVLTGMLLASRNIVPAIRFVDGLKGDDAVLHQQVEAEKKHFSGMELPGQTLGIIGLGKIGRLVADAAIKLGMKVLGYDPKITVDAAWSLPAEVKKASDIEALVHRSHILSLHVPLNDATHHMVNANLVARMQKNTILLNFARGEIVDEDAILAGIEKGMIRNYICDFPSEKLLHHPAVVALPHLGASTREAEENCAVMIADQLMDYLINGNILHSVNFPDVSIEREVPYRAAIANANVPNLLGQISTCMASVGLNIHNMVNKSRGEIAYTLVDTDKPIPLETIDVIRNITGVLMVRYIPKLS